MRTVTLIGVDGTEHVLACGTGPYHLGVRAGLWGGAPHSLITRRVANVAGVNLDRVEYRPRIVAVPISIEACDELEADQRIAALASILDPQADMILKYERPDGLTRELTVRYLTGFEQLRTPPVNNRPWIAEVPLRFQALDPYWRATTEDIQEVTETFNNGLFAESNPVTINNASDVAKVWPEISITGYAEAIEAVSLTTGQLVRIREIVTATDTLRIVTDPAHRRVYFNDVPDWTVVDTFAEFWPLVPRTNDLILRAVAPIGETIGTFSIQWRERFQTC